MTTKALSPHRFFLLIFSALTLPLLLTQCKTTKTYKSISYSPATLKTPPGHGMMQKDYPFDDDGNYRKDWVRNGSTGRTQSSRGQSSTVASTSSVGQSSGSSSSGSAYPTYAEASAARGQVTVSTAPPATAPVIAELVEETAPAESVGSPVTVSTPAPAPASSSPKYHRVVANDTLYSLSKRYGTSIAELKKINGLRGDQIRVGQSLRVP